MFSIVLGCLALAKYLIMIFLIRLSGVEGSLVVVVVVDVMFARSECVSVAATDGVRRIEFEQFGDKWLEFRFQKFFTILQESVGPSNLGGRGHLL